MSLKSFVKEIVDSQYHAIDEIWKRRISYWSVAADYDNNTIRQIVFSMPNLIVKNGGEPLDELADEYGFDGSDDLMETLKNYIPKHVAMQTLINQLQPAFEEA